MFVWFLLESRKECFSCYHLQQSDGEKSDQDLVVDDASEDPVSPHNGTASPRENGIDKLQPKKEHVGPHSPRYNILKVT